MPTTYNEIRDFFLARITDFDLANLPEVDLNMIFDKYLLASIVKFKRYCKQDLEMRDDTQRIFTIDLTLDEKHILALLSVIEWLNSKILHEQYLKQALQTKDYSIYSPANQLKELLNLKNDVTNEVLQLINLYQLLE